MEKEKNEKTQKKEKTEQKVKAWFLDVNALYFRISVYYPC